MTTLADSFALLLATRTGIIRIRPALPVSRSRTGHSRSAGRADRDAREQRRAVDYTGRRGLRIVTRQFCLHALEVVLLDQNRDSDVDDAGRIMVAPITRAAHAVGPLASGIASVGQDLVHRPDAAEAANRADRKSTRLNSSHQII